MKVKVKRRRVKKPTAWVERLKGVAADVLSGILSGLVTAIILKWLDL